MPALVGAIKDRTKFIDHGYFYVNALFIGLNVITLILNFSVYLIDIYQNDSILDKVHTFENVKNL
jgi:hypothetical protein